VTGWRYRLISDPDELKALGYRSPRSRGMDASIPPRLVDTEVACLYTGRSRATLYRWAKQGRITRHGGPQWDLNELSPHIPGQPLPSPPPLLDT
jgi:hypothetical protein